MSGRLIILPKKSYCPWKPENVERVLRDERQARERQEGEAAEQQEHESRQRLDALKKQQRRSGSSSNHNDDDDDDDDEKTNRHVNLFAMEEQAMLHKTLTGHQSEGRAQQQQVGVMPVRLDKVKVQGDKPFYVRRERFQIDPSKDGRRKASMDPIKAFVRHDAGGDACATLLEVGTRHRRPEEVNDGDRTKDDASRRRGDRLSHHCTRRRLERPSCHDDSDSQSSSRRATRHKKKRRRESKRRSKSRQKRHDGSMENRNATIEGLRRRRQEREQIESHREAALINPGRCGRDHQYQNQYNPGLSRR